MTDQGVQVTQSIEADAIATGIQDSTIDQSDTVEGGTGADAAQPRGWCAADADVGRPGVR